MSFIDSLTAKLPFFKREESLEYYFALNIETEKVSAAVWTVEANKLNIVNCVDTSYSSQDDLLSAADKVLDAALGDFVAEPDKVLFGVPDSWLSEDNLKEQYLNLLRKIVKELDLKPMAYVSTTQALSHFLENLEGAPTTAILIGLEKEHLSVSVVRAGKLDGTKVLPKGENLGQEIEKALLSFSEIEVLPSKILIYGGDNTSTDLGTGLEKIKSELLSFPWMQKLSFLHFPKISSLEEMVAVKAVAFAGAVEQNPHVKYHPQTLKRNSLADRASALMEEKGVEESKIPKVTKKVEDLEDIGFVAGDVTAKAAYQAGVEEEIVKEQPDFNVDNVEEGVAEPNLTLEQEEVIDKRSPVVAAPVKIGGVLSNLTRNFKFKGALFLPIAVLVLLLAGYLLFYKVTVRVYVEPKVLEKDTTVTADPAVKSVDEADNKIPGEVVETSVSGSGKGSATGKKQVGDSAKGTATIYNKTYNSVNLSSGTVISGSGQKFTLDTSVQIASQSASDAGITFGKKSISVTAVNIGADGNLPSGTDLTVAGYSSDQVAAKAEGNFSGGTSKEVTVVSDDDQKKLLAQVSSNLRKQAQQDLQGKLNGKKILEEALQEDITKKSYNKNIGDQASEFTLNLVAHYKGTAYSDADLRTIVSKLVETNIPSDFQLNLSETETQADVSKVEKDGRLVFLAKFKAKLMPKLDENKIKQQIKGQSLSQAISIIKGFDNVLDSEIHTNLPLLPSVLQRVPILIQNINVQTGLK